MRPWPRWATALLLFSVFTVAGLSKFAHFWLDDLTRGHPDTLLTRFIEEMTGGYAAGLVFLFLLWLVPRYPLERGRLLRRLPVYVGIVTLLALADTSIMWGSRVLLFPLAGLGAYDYGIMWYRYPMEFAVQAPDIAIMVALLHGWRWYRGQRDRELRAVQLETELGRARLERLEAQLQPHFLFNTLNAVSSMMYQDPGRADLMLGRLSDLLRLTFAGATDPEVPLATELEWLGWYLEIMQLRFGDRLAVERHVDPAALSLAVPRLLLQPLVENALKHGAAKRAGPARVVIGAELTDAGLRLSVTDDGPGIPDPAAALQRGVGLSNTVERLRTLYGARAEVRLHNRPPGGLEASILLPARRAGAVDSGRRVPELITT